MVKEETFTGLVNKNRIRLFTLKNPNGMTVQVTNYGAKIVSLNVPIENGVKRDVVLGFSTLDEWMTKEPYFNAVIGRYANRIKDGKFTLDGQTYQLARNNGKNHLHGGVSGFNDKVWDVVGQTTFSVILHYRSVAGEEKYPGTVDVYVTYQLMRDNALNITYEAKSDAPTIVGFTNHAYFNLNGDGSNTIRNHVLQVMADEYTPFDDTACPTGEILPVEGTPMDFRKPVKLADRIDDPFFAAGKGIDNNFVLRKEFRDKKSELAARISIPSLTMEVYTTMPGLQVYTGNFIEKNTGKSGKTYDVQTAICLEAQNFPNSPNIPSFPSAVLRPDDVYYEKCMYKFI